ncbi:putative hydrolase of the metallo-beta-lactamase superfamily [Burkholderiales bacterium 8X]|nr:putative hydrolase of the metallo-beta-lactamase superfamily [Burkholderiales bacterium 8X]
MSDRQEEAEAPPRGLRMFALMAGSLLGVLCQLRQPLLWGWGVYAVVVLGASVGWYLANRIGKRLRAPRSCRIALAFLIGVLLGGGAAGWRAAVYQSGALPPALEGADIVVAGVVSQLPQRSATAIRFRFEVESASWADPARRGQPAAGVPERLALAWYAENTSAWGRGFEERAPADLPLPDSVLHAGDRWRLTVRLKAPHGGLNPHGFDEELRMWEAGLRATGYVRTGARDAPAGRIESTWRYPVEQAREKVRDAVFDRVSDRRAAGVIAALVVGDQNAIERADWDVFRATGVAHLMSISGLHITLFAWLAAWAAGGAWRRSSRLMLAWPAPQAGLAVGLVLAALYALFSGWGLPAQRTVWMLAVVTVLRQTGSRWPWPFLWLAVCAAVVAIDPWAMTQAGFWLSFVAVGVLFASGSGEAPAGEGMQGDGSGHRDLQEGQGRQGRQGQRSLLGSLGAGPRLRQMAREQATVTLALAPLGLLLFQQVSLVGLFANAIAIPWVTLVVTPLAMLGVLIPWLWQLAAWAVQGLNLLLDVLAGWSWASLSAAAPPVWAAVAGVAGGVLLAMRLPVALRVLGLPLLLPAFLWLPPRPVPGEFDLLAADVGQGNAVLVRTASHSLLYDAGPRYSLESDAGHRVLAPLLRALDESLDTIVLSHRDLDHTGGAAAVLAMQPQAVLRSSIEAEHPLQRIRAAKPCIAGQRWEWDGVSFEMLHPRPEDYAGTPKPNAISCVLKIGSSRASALLAGDIEQPQEAALLARAADLKADLLLAPHHGSKTSSSAAFLDAVQPRVVIVQAGYRNRFGHPAPEVRARYEARGVSIADSPHCGAAMWSSVRAAELRCQRETGRRYWHHEAP